nr:MAG TPA: hydrolase [Bacteriophage sp.]
MAKLYTVSGTEIPVGSAGASDFGVADYSIYEDDAGNSARQATLTYQGKRLYPKNYPAQRLDFIRDYGGGVMLTLGDSYTAYMSTFFDAFATKHGLVQDNRGLASSTIAGSADGVTVGYHAFWVRLDTAVEEYTATGGHTVDGTAYTASDVKLVTVMGGANDWSTVDASQGIDRLGDPTSTDKEQLHGACKYIFDKLLNSFPYADIVVILQPSNAAKGNYEMWRKESIVCNMAEMYGLQICDCCFEWYNPSNPNDAATYWQSDNLHLTAAGHQAVIDKLEHTVNNLPFSRAE